MPRLIFYLENIIIGHLFSINHVLLSDKGLSQNSHEQVTLVSYTNTGFSLLIQEEGTGKEGKPGEGVTLTNKSTRDNIRTIHDRGS